MSQVICTILHLANLDLENYDTLAELSKVLYKETSKFQCKNKELLKLIEHYIDEKLSIMILKDIPQMALDHKDRKFYFKNE